MTGDVGFENSFWDSDITSANGCDRLFKRMKDGKKMCSVIAHFLKDRAKADADYSKTLSTLARKADADSSDEIGILGLSWKQMKVQTEEIARLHDESSKYFQSLSEKLNQFNEEQKKTKQQQEEMVKRAHRNKSEAYNKAMNLKKNYEGKCRDLNQTTETLNTMRQSVTVTKKELEKATNKQEKCKESMSNADLSYKSSIDSLDGARVNWEMLMESACKIFENLEMERIDFLRNTLWEATNTSSLVCVNHDEACESVREVLEGCDVINDIMGFIELNRTGSERPSHVPYENYYEKQSTPQKQICKLPPSRPPSFNSSRPPALPPGRPSPPRPGSGQLNFTDFQDLDCSSSYTSVNVSATLPPRLHVAQRQQQPSYDDSTYSSLADTWTDTKPPMAPDAPSQSKQFLTVIRPYTGTGPSELTVAQGTILEYIGGPRNGLIRVKLTESRMCGIIPESHVRSISDTQLKQMFPHN